MNNLTLPSNHWLMPLIMITVLAALLVSCGGNDVPMTVPEGAQAGDLVGLETCKYEVNKIEYAADCGTLVVPENRTNDNSRLITMVESCCSGARSKIPPNIRCDDSCSTSRDNCCSKWMKRMLET
jgi:hypothetical protein